MTLKEALASIDAYEADRSFHRLACAQSDAMDFVAANRDRLLRAAQEDAAREFAGCGEMAPVAFLEARDDEPIADELDGFFCGELVICGQNWKAS